jgi:beta-N-acetylhexosaminidase
MIFFTDSEPFQQCSDCPEQVGLGVDDLRQAVIRLYGPDTGGQILPYNLVSFSFEALTQVLNAPPGDTILEQTLRSADWVIFLTGDEDENRPSSLALRRFLSERPTAFRNKRLIVFALDTPYFLDATDISKLTAYYGLYSKAPQFVDVAARLLFKELRPIPGALPVSVPGVGYDLISATSPDPDQIIPLFLVQGESTPVLESTNTPADTPPEFKVGDFVTVRTGVILDHNNHPVPDETPIQFILTIGGQEAAPQTKNLVSGTADFTFVIETAGALSVVARSGEPPAYSSPLQIDIPTENGEPLSTESPVLPTVSPTVEPSATARPRTPTPTPGGAGAIHTKTDIGDWLLAVLASGVIGWVAYQVGTATSQFRWGFRWGLCALIGGLFVYTSLSLNFPGTQWFMENWGRWAAILLSLAGAGIGWSFGIAWRSLERLRIP